MSNERKLFIVTAVAIVVSGVLFYKGIQEQLKVEGEVERVKGEEIVQEASESAEVLGEQKESSSAGLVKKEVEQYPESYLVTKVHDGDTIEVLIDGQKQNVRFIGIDTPETVDPRRPVGCFGKEASDETKKLLTGKKVVLEKDITNTDKYNRLLRYVFLPLGGEQTLFVNDYLVREGFAQVYTYPPDVKYDAQFLDAQQIAKNGKKGLWGKCQ